jgi:hypothetical protein
MVKCSSRKSIRATARQGSKFGGYRLLLSHLQAFGSSSLKILFVAALLTLNLEL